MNRVLISSLPGELRLARLVDGRLAELRVERGRGGGEAGDLHMGRIKRLDRSQKAAFCDIGLGQDGFLPLDEAPKSLSEGDLLPLQVRRAASEGKGPKLSLFRGQMPPGLERQGAPCLLLRADDPVLALKEGEAPEEILLDDPALLRRLQRLLGEGQAALADRLKLYSGLVPLFEAEGLEPEVEALLQPEVPLPGGGRLWIETTRALVAVDVDRGKAASARAVNLEAAREIARQLRLRQLSGLIVIDFLDPEGPEPRKELRGAFEAALAGDPAASELKRLGGNGVLMMTRQRLRPALHERLCEPGQAWRPSAGTQAFTALRAALAAGLGNPGKRVRLEAAPEVLRALEGEAAEALAAVEQRLGAPLERREAGALPGGDRGFELVIE
jgi:ribonuclease G